MDFHQLGLSEPLIRAVSEVGFTQPTDIQSKVLRHVLQGRDILGLAQTGSGKTAAFVLPMLDILERRRSRPRMPRALILEPTRELAVQVQEVIADLGRYHGLESALLIGGEPLGPQEKSLLRGPDVLVATPGRLLDLFERGSVMFVNVQYFVIDEADRMLDMGFMPDVERIVSIIPATQRQTLFFSATLPDAVEPLTKSFLSRPVRVETAPKSSASQHIRHCLVAVRAEDKAPLLAQLTSDAAVERGIVFCNRKRDIQPLVRYLRRHSAIPAAAIEALHGDISQEQRMQALGAFRQGQVRLLVASDVAARGIDVEGIAHIFLHDVPMHAEDYIHRSGRTGRAGQSGVAYMLAQADDGEYVEGIEALLRRGGQTFERMTAAAMLGERKGMGRPMRGGVRGSTARRALSRRGPMGRSVGRGGQARQPSQVESKHGYLPSFLVKATDKADG